MNLIKKDKPNTIVQNNYTHTFEIQESGLYFIEIIASAKSWWQNFKSLKSFFDGDDLAVKVDSIEFPKLNGKSGLFDGEAAWNGNNLKGLSKTNIFLVNLEKGNHSFNFSADQNPILESIAIYKIDKAEINYIPENNNPAQDGDRRQWVTIIPVNISVKKLSIKANAKNYLEKKDDDDIKIIIDGNIQKNETEKSHKNWFWCGRILNNQEKEFSKELNFESGLHYVELWADGMPEVKNIKFAINAIDNSELAKRIPTVDDPEWTGNFNDDSEQMILARVIFGEARSLPEKGRIAVGWSIKNRVIDSRWDDTYYEVILKPRQYSAFSEHDPNFKYIKNPLLNKTQEQDWYDCYEIAGKIINGKADDPTNGANHYFSNYINPPYWSKQKNAEFKIQVGNTLFYDVKQKNNGGFIKNTVIISVCAIILITGFFYVVVKTNNWRDSKKEIFHVWKAEKYKHFFINPKTEEIEVVHLDEDGSFLRIRQITNDGYPKNNLSVFPDSEMLGYFQELYKYGEGYAGNEEEYYKNYTVLLIKNSEYEKPYEVYKGDIHTSSWNWADKNHVVVYYDCGSACRYFYKIDIATKEVTEEGHENNPVNLLCN